MATEFLRAGYGGHIMDVAPSAGGSLGCGMSGAALRVGVIGPLGPDSFADNIVDALAGMRHVPIALGPAIPGARHYRHSQLVTGAWDVMNRSVAVTEAWQRRIVRAARAAEVDLVINIHAPLLPSTVDELRTDGTPVVFWFPDPVSQLGRQLMLVGSYDAVFFKDPLLVQRLRAVTDLPAHYLPEACNPSWHRPGPRADVDPVVVVAGSFYPSRVALLERLYNAGIPLALYGGPWPRWMAGGLEQILPVRPPVHRHVKARVFRCAAAVLNNLQLGEMNSLNCRAFEAAGCGAVVLCEDRPVLPDHFQPGSELLVFTTFDELVDHARAALARPLAMTSIGDAAARRAHRDHTYAHRLDEILTVLGLH